MKLKEVHIVTVIESERGWGQKTDEVAIYDNKAEAEAHVKRVNSDNQTLASAPDIYWRAEMRSFYEKR
jgi:hypothetical protein